MVQLSVTLTSICRNTGDVWYYCALRKDFSSISCQNNMETSGYMIQNIMRWKDWRLFDTNGPIIDIGYLLFIHFFWPFMFNNSIEILIECLRKRSIDWHNYEYESYNFCFLSKKYIYLFILQINTKLQIDKGIHGDGQCKWSWRRATQNFLTEGEWFPVAPCHHPWVMGMQPLITLFLLAPSQVVFSALVFPWEFILY
jgi:hypothetical protein